MRHRLRPRPTVFRSLHRGLEVGGTETVYRSLHRGLDFGDGIAFASFPLSTVFRSLHRGLEIVGQSQAPVSPTVFAPRMAFATFPLSTVFRSLHRGLEIVGQSHVPVSHTKSPASLSIDTLSLRGMHKSNLQLLVDRSGWQSILSLASDGTWRFTAPCPDNQLCSAAPVSQANDRRSAMSVIPTFVLRLCVWEWMLEFEYSSAMTCIFVYAMGA